VNCFSKITEPGLFLYASKFILYDGGLMNLETIVVDPVLILSSTL